MTRSMSMLAVLAALLSAPAQAALYRCGNAFQDRPCDAGVPQQQLRPSGREAKPAAGAASAGKPAAAVPAAMPAASAASGVIRLQPSR